MYEDPTSFKKNSNFITKEGHSHLIWGMWESLVFDWFWKWSSSKPGGKSSEGPIDIFFAWRWSWDLWPTVEGQSSDKNNFTCQGHTSISFQGGSTKTQLESNVIKDLIYKYLLENFHIKYKETLFFFRGTKRLLK